MEYSDIYISSTRSLSVYDSDPTLEDRGFIEPIQASGLERGFIDPISMSGLERGVHVKNTRKSCDVNGWHWCTSHAKVLKLLRPIPPPPPPVSFPELWPIYAAIANTWLGCQRISIILSVRSNRIELLVKGVHCSEYGKWKPMPRVVLVAPCLAKCIESEICRGNVICVKYIKK